MLNLHQSLKSTLLNRSTVGVDGRKGPVLYQPLKYVSWTGYWKTFGYLRELEGLLKCIEVICSTKRQAIRKMGCFCKAICSSCNLSKEQWVLKKWLKNVVVCRQRRHWKPSRSNDSPNEVDRLPNRMAGGNRSNIWPIYAIVFDGFLTGKGYVLEITLTINLRTLFVAISWMHAPLGVLRWASWTNFVEKQVYWLQLATMVSHIKL